MAIRKTHLHTAKAHLRQNFIAGLFSFVPLAITAFIVWWIDQNTHSVTDYVFHRRIPFIGVILALLAIYLTGLITTSLLGRMILGSIDHLLVKVPLVGQVYLSWKQIALTPGGSGGTFSRVVLIPDETGQMQLMGFTSGRGECRPGV